MDDPEFIQALAEQPAQQEPVAVVDGDDHGYFAEILPDRNVKVGQFLYASPPAQRKPLTDVEMWNLWNAQGNDAMNQQEAIAFARAIEAAHNIKGDT